MPALGSFCSLGLHPSGPSITLESEAVDRLTPNTDNPGPLDGSGILGTAHFLYLFSLPFTLDSSLPDGDLLPGIRMTLPLSQTKPNYTDLLTLSSTNRIVISTSPALAGWMPSHPSKPTASTSVPFSLPTSLLSSQSHRTTSTVHHACRHARNSTGAALSRADLQPYRQLHIPSWIPCWQTPESKDILHISCPF